MFKQSARGIYWHGTSTKYLREILKKGLIPDPKELQYGKLFQDGEIGEHSIKTYGGVYITNNIGLAFNYAKDAAKNTGKDRLMIACTYETRTPTALLDEDLLLMQLGESANIRAGLALFSPNMVWGKLLALNTYPPDIYPIDFVEAYTAIKNINKKNAVFRDMVIDFIEVVSLDNPKLESRIQRNRNKIEEQVAETIIFYVLHLLEAYFVAQKSNIETRTFLSQSFDAEKQKKVWEILPKLLGGSYTNLVKSVNKMTRLLKEMSSEEKESGHNLRVQEPITYRGKNRILELIHIKEDKDNSLTVDVAFGRNDRVYGLFRRFLTSQSNPLPIQFLSKGEVELYFFPRNRKEIPSHWDAEIEDFDRSGYYAP